MSCNREEEKNRIMQETLKQIHAPSAVTHTKTFRKLVGQFLNSVQNEGIKTACSRTSVYIAKHLRFSRQCQDAYYSINACSGDTIARDVVFVPGVSGPSQRYRVNNIAEGLSELGYDVSVLPGHRVGRLLEVKPPGAVVFFRCAHCSHLPFVQAAASLHQRGTRVIMDHDDIVFNPEIVNSIDSYRKMNKGEQRVYMSDVLRYRELMFFGDAATVTTKSLAKEAESLIENVHILPNTVNVRQIGLSEKLLAHPLEKRPGITIMYSSGTTTHDADFMQCSEALMRFMEQRPESKFLLMGYLKLPNGFNQFGDRVIRLPFRDYETHLRECSRADINIAPLESTPFNNAKSELKIFEPGLVEVPTIMSPVASYAEYVQDGIDGVLAANEDEWHKAFTRLADDAELRASMGKRARQKALDKNHYRNVAAEAARIYGLDAEVHARVLPETIAEPNFLKKPNISHLRISWIVADIILGSGGLRNIFRAAHHLSRLGHDIDIYVVNTDLHNADLLKTVHEHFYKIKARIRKYSGSISKCDVLFATHWSTVKYAQENRNATRDVMYFVQDFEPYFDPMGSDYIMAEDTYRLGLYHITSGLWCERFLRERYHAEADHFQFPVDREVYHPRRRKKKRENIIFFAKPEMPRRCYKIGIAALEKFHALRPETELIFYGSKNVDPSALPFPITLRSYIPTLAELAEMYSNADLGMVFSPTNPSLVPYEMMACGLPVVDLHRGDNQSNYGDRGDIAFLADSIPEVMAEQMVELLSNREELEGRRLRGLEFVKTFPREEEMAQRIESLIKARMTRL